jgi:hypothetical protein
VIEIGDFIRFYFEHIVLQASLKSLATFRLQPSIGGEARGAATTAFPVFQTHDPSNT